MHFKKRETFDVLKVITSKHFNEYIKSIDVW